MEFERGVSGGPWDESDSGVPLVESVGDRVVSFGALRLRVPEGVEVQVQADKSTGRISLLTLRAVFMGAAARDIDAGARLGLIFESAVVSRGDTAMAPGAPIVLNLPENTNTDKAAPIKSAGINPFVRGPEITEIR